MRSINFRQSFHRVSALLEWLVSGWLCRYKFIEVAGPVTTKTEKVK